MGSKRAKSMINIPEQFDMGQQSEKIEKKASLSSFFNSITFKGKPEILSPGMNPKFIFGEKLMKVFLCGNQILVKKYYNAFSIVFENEENGPLRIPVNNDVFEVSIEKVNDLKDLKSCLKEKNNLEYPYYFVITIRSDFDDEIFKQNLLKLLKNEKEKLHILVYYEEENKHEKLMNDAMKSDFQKQLSHHFLKFKNVDFKNVKKFSQLESSFTDMLKRIK
eukprot:gene7586-11909_t